MDTLQLEYFLAVARTGNMTTAAASLNVAQSSVSRSIARLEDSLGVPLFDRNGRGIALNDYGKLFYARAEAIMREVGDGERELKEIRDSHLGRVSISTCSPRAINPLMLSYIEDHPEVLFRQRRLTDMNTIKSHIDTGILDYALTYTPLAGMEYEWLPLLTERYYLLVPADHPFADREQVALSDLNGISLIVNAYDTPDLIEIHCRQEGVSPSFTFISDEYELLGSLVERGFGAAPITTLALYDMKSSLPFQHFSRIRVIPIADTHLHRTLGILYRKHHYISSAARSFYKQLLAYFKNIDMNTPET